MTIQVHIMHRTGAPICSRNGQIGVTSIEYALIGVLLSLAIMGGLSLVGANVAAFYDYVMEAVGNVVCKAVSCQP